MKNCKIGPPQEKVMKIEENLKILQKESTPPGAPLGDTGDLSPIFKLDD